MILTDLESARRALSFGIIFAKKQSGAVLQRELEFYVFGQKAYQIFRKKPTECSFSTGARRVFAFRENNIVQGISEVLANTHI